MDRRNKRRGWLTVGVAFLCLMILSSCTGAGEDKVKTNSSAFLDRVQKLVDDQNTSFRLGDAATFDWDEAWIFNPYATKEEIELRMGIKDPLFKDSSGNCQVIFAKEKKVVAYVGSIDKNFSFSYPLAISVNYQPLNKDTPMGIEKSPQGAVVFLEKFKPKIDANQPGKKGRADSKLTGKATLNLSKDEYPRVDGSTATIPLSEAFGATVMDVPLEEARQRILHNTTHKAYVNLIEGKADIIFVTSPSKEELELAKEEGVELEVIPVVSEGFVFLVNGKNPVESLTFDEIKKIYQGKITNWKEVGGEDKKIITFQRPVNSGSQTGMLDLVLSKDEIMEAPKENIRGGMGELIESVASYNNSEDAIGYSCFYYATDMWINENIRFLAVDGVKPESKTIRDGTYPIRTAYYAVMNKNAPADSNARKLLKWILSDQGQVVAEEAGYVPLK